MSDYESEADDDVMYVPESSDDSGMSGEDALDDDSQLPMSIDQALDVDEYPFKVLSTEEIMLTMLDLIKEVNTVVQLPQTITRILLHHFKWDKEKLYEHYYANDDPDKLFADAHIINPYKIKAVEQQNQPQQAKQQPVPANRRATRSSTAHPVVAPPPPPTPPQPTTVDCLICYLELSPVELISIACGHQFCRDCWIQYLTTKIMDEGQAQTISCANHDCDILIDDETVFELITEPKVLLRYKQHITNSFIEASRLFRWCPKPECGSAIRVEHAEFKSVKCACNTIFCFLCGDAWHFPLKCELLKKWQKKCSDDSETFNWIAANTKDCPKCKMPIEKNGGCNHMWCRNPSCKYEFCWLCMGDWARHGYNPCNRYSEADGNASKDAQERARAVLQRYLFYCNRYMNHMQSLKFEQKLYDGVKAKMEEMQHHNMSWVEVQFLNTAVDVLISCRQSLMYTYAFAFYLVKNNQVHIFEDNQKDLELATEQLSEYLERDITEDSLSSIKQNVQDKYRYCDSRRKALICHVKEGYEKDIWVYANNTE